MGRTKTCNACEQAQLANDARGRHTCSCSDMCFVVGRSVTVYQPMSSREGKTALSVTVLSDPFDQLNSRITHIVLF